MDLEKAPITAVESFYKTVNPPPKGDVFERVVYLYDAKTRTSIPKRLGPDEHLGAYGD